MKQYKVGDRIKMGPVEWQKKKMGKDCFLPVAPDETGEIYEIESESCEYDYRIKLSRCCQHENLIHMVAIYQEQILGYMFEYGEEIEVSNDKETWFVMKFSTNCPGLVDSKVSVFDNDKNCLCSYARPLNKASEPVKLPESPEARCRQLVKTINDCCEKILTIPPEFLHRLNEEYQGGPKYYTSRRGEKVQVGQYDG